MERERQTHARLSMCLACNLVFRLHRSLLCQMAAAAAAASITPAANKDGNAKGTESAETECGVDAAAALKSVDKGVVDENGSGNKKDDADASEDKFWIELEAGISSWTSARDVFLGWAQRVNNTPVPNDEALLILRMREASLRGAVDRAFIRIAEICATFVRHQAATYTYAMLESSLRQRRLPLFVLARAWAVGAPEEADGLLPRLRGTLMPFRVNYVVVPADGIDGPYLAQERKAAMESCVASKKLDEQQSAVAVSDDPQALAALNLQLLAKAGELTILTALKAPAPSS